MEGKTPERHPLFTKVEKYNEFVDKLNELANKYNEIIARMKEGEELMGTDFEGRQEFVDQLKLIREYQADINQQVTKLVMEVYALKKKMEREN